MSPRANAKFKKSEKIDPQTGIQKIVFTSKQFLYDKCFNIGFNDSANGREFRREYETWERYDQEMYERGRMFYAFMKVNNARYIVTKNGKAVNEKAIPWLA